jgi:hypothetical protein
MGLKEEPPKPPPIQVPDAPPPEAERAPRRKDSDEEALKQYALQAVLRQEAEAKAAEIKAKEEEQRQREFDALPDDQKRDRLEATLRDLRQKHGALKKARAYDEMNAVGALAASRDSWPSHFHESGFFVDFEAIRTTSGPSRRVRETAVFTRQRLHETVVVIPRAASDRDAPRRRGHQKSERRAEEAAGTAEESRGTEELRRLR